MTLKDYYATLTKMIEEDPSILDCEIIYAKDDEGNSYHSVNWHPSVMYTSEVEYEMDARSRTDLVEEGKYVDDYIKVVCVN